MNQLNIKVTQFDRSGNTVVKTETKPFKPTATKHQEVGRECLAFGESFTGPGVNDIEVFNDREELMFFAKTGI
jgi:hypothetical protein